MTEWKPIETAPKDGSWFIAGKFGRGDGLLYVRDCSWVTAANFFDDTGDVLEGEHDESEPEGGFIDGDSDQRWPTHWMPLPAPPESTGGQP